MTGNIYDAHFGVYPDQSGVFTVQVVGTYPGGAGTAGYKNAHISFDASRMVPTGNANKPRAWGSLACVYLGAPR